MDAYVFTDALCAKMGPHYPGKPVAPGASGVETACLSRLFCGSCAPAVHGATCTHFRPHAHADAACPHHCTFVDAAFGDANLRLDCGDHEPAPAEAAAALWRRFAAARS